MVKIDSIRFGKVDKMDTSTSEEEAEETDVEEEEDPIVISSDEEEPSVPTTDEMRAEMQKQWLNERLAANAELERQRQAQKERERQEKAKAEEKKAQEEERAHEERKQRKREKKAAKAKQRAQEQEEREKAEFVDIEANVLPDTFLCKGYDLEVPYDPTRSYAALYELVMQMLLHRFGDKATEWVHPTLWIQHLENTLEQMMDPTCEFSRFNLGVLQLYCKPDHETGGNKIYYAAVRIMYKDMMTIEEVE